MAEERMGGDGGGASEIRHRMANIFQLLSALARMRSQRASEPEARRQLAWMADAIGSLGVFTVSIYVGLAVVFFLVYPVIVRAHGLSVRNFYSGV